MPTSTNLTTATRFPTTKIVSVGFSMGGNLITKVHPSSHSKWHIIPALNLSFTPHPPSFTPSHPSSQYLGEPRVKPRNVVAGLSVCQGYDAKKAMEVTNLSTHLLTKIPAPHLAP